MRPLEFYTLICFLSLAECEVATGEIAVNYRYASSDCLGGCGPDVTHLDKEFQADIVEQK